MKAHQILISALLGAASFILTGCQQHTLFKNGSSDYSIVIAPEAPESEQRSKAAHQRFERWTKRKTSHRGIQSNDRGAHPLSSEACRPR